MTHVSRNRRRGAAAITAVIILVVVMAMLGSLARGLFLQNRQARLQSRQTQAHWLARAGLARAQLALATNAAYGGETWQPEVGEIAASPGLRGRVVVEVVQDGGGRRVAVHAWFPEQIGPVTGRCDLELELPARPGGG